MTACARDAVRLRDLAPAPARPVAVVPLAAPERRVRDDRDAVLAAVRQLVRLDRALAQMVEHLIARDLLALERGLRLAQVVDVEVAHAERTDLAVGDELLERAHRVGQRMLPRQCKR